MTAATPAELNTNMTERARRVWSQGDFARAGAEQVIVGELLARAIDIHAGQRVLDVAAGSGNAALAAARRGASVTATDFVPALLETAARRARVEGLELETREADAQDLPFPDASFDVVLSTFGVMFAPDPSRAASELLRVCRPGGRIGLTAWTPDSVMAAIQAIAAQYAPARPGARSPIEWGTEARVRELLGDGVRELAAQVLSTDMCGISPAARVEFNRTYVGPTKALFDRLGPDDQQALATELARCLDRFNRATDGTLVAPADYLQVVAVRAAG
jgi:ubiquinone/menaquinone biosynthesis C-methylase UbiE